MEHKKKTLDYKLCDCNLRHLRHLRHLRRKNRKATRPKVVRQLLRPQMIVGVSGETFWPFLIYKSSYSNKFRFDEHPFVADARY